MWWAERSSVEIWNSGTSAGAALKPIAVGAPRARRELAGHARRSPWWLSAHAPRRFDRRRDVCIKRVLRLPAPHDRSVPRSDRYPGPDHRAVSGPARRRSRAPRLDHARTSARRRAGDDEPALDLAVRAVARAAAVP